MYPINHLQGDFTTLTLELPSKGGQLLQFYLKKRVTSLANNMLQKEQACNLPINFDIIAEAAVRATWRIFANALGVGIEEIDRYCFVEGAISIPVAQLLAASFGHPDYQDFLS